MTLGWGEAVPSEDMVFSWDSKMLFAIKRDGTVQLGEGVTLDEAGNAFWVAVAEMAPQGFFLDLSRGNGAVMDVQ